MGLLGLHVGAPGLTVGSAPGLPVPEGLPLGTLQLQKTHLSDSNLTQLFLDQRLLLTNPSFESSYRGCWGQALGSLGLPSQVWMILGQHVSQSICAVIKQLTGTGHSLKRETFRSHSLGSQEDQY